MTVRCASNCSGEHVPNRAHEIAATRQSALCAVSREAEVTEEETIVRVQQQVVRLDVPVHDAVAMRVLQRIDDADEEREHTADVCPSVVVGYPANGAERAAQLLEHHMERLALHELHRQVGDAALDPCSYTFTMCGCARRPPIHASRSNRSAPASVGCPPSTLSATRRRIDRW